ncbi:Alanine--tRNA ligase, partial [Dimargaris xerosporica]
MAEEHGLTINEQEFAEEQAKAKALSKANRGRNGAQGQRVALNVHALGALDSQGVPKTDDGFKYHPDPIQAQVLALYLHQEFVDSVNESMAATTEDTPMFGVLLNRTNFYAEQGGQEYDTGTLVAVDGGSAEFVVEDVQVFGGYVLHIGYLKYGELSKGMTLECQFDEERRAPLRHNHTATHLLNFALRKVLTADTVDQKGSLVAPEKLRFDFSYKHTVTPDQLLQIEEICNEMINRQDPVYYKDVPLAVAKAIHGLRAVFGEVYPDPVRVVSVGHSVDDILQDISNPKWEENSIEFCGGTHVSNTHDIKRLVITEESSIAKGVRRIVAVTGEEALRAQATEQELTTQINHLASLPAGPALDTALKALGSELSAAFISAHAKHTLRKTYDAAKKRFDDADKAQKAEQVKQAL